MSLTYYKQEGPVYLGHWSEEQLQTAVKGLGLNSSKIPNTLDIVSCYKPANLELTQLKILIMIIEKLPITEYSEILRELIHEEISDRAKI
eukprot:COSAG01_NODE_165_length_23303_cov_269.524953_11_plen_90_part_00